MQRFGSFEFDPATLTLMREGEVVRVPRKSVELFALLAERPGEVVSTTMLRATLWPAGCVEERNLAQQVYVLRHALASDPCVRIENVPRRGYRLSAPVSQEPGKTAWDGSSIVSLVVRYASAAAAIVVLLATPGVAARRPIPQLPSAAARANELGWLQWERRDPSNLSIAERYFRQTMRLAPDDARGYAGMAAVHVIRGDIAEGYGAKKWFSSAAAFATQALALDPRNANALDVRGLLALIKDNDPRAADLIFQQAQAADDRNPYSHVWRGIALFDDGRLEDARREFVRGEELDPGSKTAARWLGAAYYNERAFEEAAEQFRTVLEIDPRDTEAVLYMEHIDEARRDYNRALARLGSSNLMIPNEKRVTLVARLDALQGRTDLARHELAKLRWMQHVDPVELAATQLSIGQRHAALETLHRIPQAKRAEMDRALQWDARFDALRHLALGEHAIETPD